MGTFFTTEAFLLWRQGAAMIIRKSNIAGDCRGVGISAFHSLAWVERPGNRRLAFVTLRDEDLTRLMQHDVLIDGSSYFCVGVQRFVPGPCRTGDTVGIVVAGA